MGVSHEVSFVFLLIQYHFLYVLLSEATQSPIGFGPSGLGGGGGGLTASTVTRCPRFHAGTFPSREAMAEAGAPSEKNWTRAERAGLPARGESRMVLRTGEMDWKRFMT